MLFVNHESRNYNVMYFVDHCGKNFLCFCMWDYVCFWLTKLCTSEMYFIYMCVCIYLNIYTERKRFVWNSFTEEVHIWFKHFDWAVFDYKTAKVLGPKSFVFWPISSLISHCQASLFIHIVISYHFTGGNNKLWNAWKKATQTLKV